MPRQGRSRRRRGPTASLYGAWRSAKLGHWDRRPNATQSGNFKPVVLGEIHAAGNTTAAAIASARLMKLPAEKIPDVVGITVSMASGLNVNFGTMTKPLHSG